MAGADVRVFGGVRLDVTPSRHTFSKLRDDPVCNPILLVRLQV